MVLSNGAAARLEAEGPDGLRLVRSIHLGRRYEVMIEDTFVNDGAVVKVLPVHTISLGEMGMLKNESHMSGMDFLAIDTLSATGGESVRHWASKRWFSDDLTLGDYFQEDGVRGRGCVGRPKMTKALPHSIQQRIDHDLDWVAVKNKFFVQILAPAEGKSSGCNLIARRTPSEREAPSDSQTWDSLAVLSGVAADLRLPERALAPGDTFRQTFSYYVGPKELSSISPLGRHMKEVMDFGTLKWLCEGLVWGLNGRNSQLWHRHHPIDADCPHRVLAPDAQGDGKHEADASAPAPAQGAAGEIPGQAAEAPAGDHGDVSRKQGQPAGRLPADADPDPGVFRALQCSAQRH
jgi:hypothetical protein